MKVINTISDWLENTIPSCTIIVEKKYIHGPEITGREEPETIQEFLQRISLNNPDYYDLIAETSFLPGGRIIANLELTIYGIKCTFSNCYVLEGPYDNIESIWDTAKYLAKTFSHGGGAGIDISRLAPKGAIVRNTANASSGAVSFIEVFSNVANVIGSHGRRAALMICINDTHPDLEEFITYKTKLENANTANMSVKMSDAFFEALDNEIWYRKNYDENPYELAYEEDTSYRKWKLSFTREATGQIIEKEVNPDDIMDLIAKTAWDYGEPGILYWDTINRNSLMGADPDFHYEATNPCVSGDTPILTEVGYIPIRNLVGYRIKVWNGFEWSMVEPMITGTNQPMRTIQFSDGSHLRCTDYHKFILADGTRVEARNLKPDMKLMKHDFPIIQGTLSLEEKTAYTKGFLAGDGCIDKRGRNFIHLYGEKIKLTPFLEYKTCNGPSKNGRYTLLLDNHKYTEISEKFFVPNAQYDIQTRLHWLAGIMDSDGTLNGSSGCLAITSINYEFLQEIKFMLNTLGCDGKIGICKDLDFKMMPGTDYDENGQREYKEYFCKPSHRLTISAFNVFNLMQMGFTTHRVPLVSNISKDGGTRFVKVKMNMPSGTDPVVYCFNEPKNHSGIFGGVMTANCGGR